MSTRTKRNRLGPEAGISLLEMICLVALLGTLVVLLAPVSSRLRAALGETRGRSGQALTLGLAHAQLAADARRARSLRSVRDGLELELLDGVGVRWSTGAEGLDRSASDAAATKRYPGVALARIERADARLLALELTASDGRRLPLTVAPRTQGRSR